MTISAIVYFGLLNKTPFVVVGLDPTPQPVWLRFRGSSPPVWRLGLWRLWVHFEFVIRVPAPWADIVHLNFSRSHRSYVLFCQRSVHLFNQPCSISLFFIPRNSGNGARGPKSFHLLTLQSNISPLFILGGK